jgi:spore germination cell wall hydrolase CwlJ-like protein
MSYSKIGYYKVITSLVGIILLLILFIIIIPPKVEIKEVEVEKEIIVEVEKQPTYAYNITSKEREMLARLVYLEANTESLECQMAIVSVVINRWQDGMWGDTLEEVVYYPYQFTPSSLIYKTTPTETNYQAVDSVLQNGCTLPTYCMYFRANYHFNWNGYEPYTKIDKTCFGYFEVDKNEK